jgi:heme-degrading monooxygenase HmoA
MFARVTTFDIDTLRISIEDASARFAAEVAPAMREQPGYEGAYLMHTPEGRGLLVTLWTTEVTLYRSPPDRDHYQVAFAEALTPQPEHA